MRQKNDLLQIWGMFFVFICLFIANFFITLDIDKTQMTWLILEVCVTTLSIIMLLKNKLPGKKQILLSFLFGSLMFLAYYGLNFSSIRTFAITFLCSLASFSIFNKYKDSAISLLKSNSIKSVVVSIIIGVLVGVIWGIGNLLLNNAEWSVRVTMACFLTALSPGIYEEISFRMFLYAICLYFMKGEIFTRSQRITCYFMMIVPHVLIHTPNIFVTNGLISGIISIVIFALLFGFPFAVLQRKRDLTSAMISHWLVDVIRFCVFGIPH